MTAPGNSSSWERKVSVIVPTYNRANLIHYAIDSILAQTVPVLEIIVVNDGSTDDTAEVLNRYGNEIRYLEQSNRGKSAALDSPPCRQRQS